MRELVAEHPRLDLHYLPPYAPDLNASEMLWCLSKYHRLANHAISDVDQLHAQAQRVIGQVATQPQLLRACFKHAGLALWKVSAQ